MLVRVLLADFDLFSDSGGGQTFYRSLARRHPEIEFSFYATRRYDPAELPKNVRAIRLRHFYRARRSRGDTAEVVFANILPWCLNMAACVAGSSFDVVDFPDYSQFGVLLRDAFAFQGVSVGTYSLSMHGVLSTTHRRNWRSGLMSEQYLAALERIERLQYESVDIRYGISTRYIEEWRQRTGLDAELYDPLRVVDTDPLPSTFTGGQAPRICFIGRPEKRKGPELAIDMVSALPLDRKQPLYFIGPECHAVDGASSTDILRSYAATRNVEVVFGGSKDAAELRDLLREPWVVLVPSRYDTFNLVALEAVIAGVPTFIGDGAGVCDFLDRELSKVPYFKVDTSNVFASSPALADVLGRYSHHRSMVESAIAASSLAQSSTGIDAIYVRPHSFHEAARTELTTEFERALRRHGIKRARTSIHVRQTALEAAKARARSSPAARNAFRVYREIRSSPATVTRKLALAAADRLRCRARAIELFFLFRSLQLGRTLRAVGAATDIASITPSLAEHRFGRGALLRAVAAAKRLGPLLTATYELRALRYAGPAPELVKSAMRNLREAGFAEESGVLELLYPTTSGSTSPDAAARYLDDRRKQLGVLETPVFELVDDRREPGHSYKVSVIVSAYNAAGKLGHFLRLLKAQTAVTSGEVELVIVDSGSTGDDRFATHALFREAGIPGVYARTAARETIQHAWNRGLYLSTAPYVTMLGVDETLRPDALRTLASLLDENPDVDWVMADSVVTETDDAGEWQRDLITYDREGFSTPLHVLECCYLSYVGGLYRKAIHEQVGYYDPTFRAAGDTEFKNRALPWIRAIHHPEPLGVFLNYPGERTTAHPRAEIEDLRAWYVFRSPGGLQYLTRNLSKEARVKLLRDALDYRKSYAHVRSQDLDLAESLCQVLESCDGWLAAPGLRTAIRDAKNALDRLDDCSGHPVRNVRAYMRARRSLRRLDREFRVAFGRSRTPLTVFRDNRFEQHGNIWNDDLG